MVSERRRINKNKTHTKPKRSYPTIKTTYVNKPHFSDQPFDMSQNLLYMLIMQKMLKRCIQTITIEVDELTRIDYVIVPGRWVDRLYDNEMLRRGTL